MIVGCKAGVEICGIADVCLIGIRYTAKQINEVHDFTLLTIVNCWVCIPLIYFQGGLPRVACKAN